MSERRDYFRAQPEHVRLGWCEWLRSHNIDPDQVAVPGFVEIDKENQQIRYLAYDLDENGRRYPDETGEASTSVRTCQMDTEPLDFPVFSVTKGATDGEIYEPISGTDAGTFIAWKNTDVCICVRCPCGQFGHYDGDFAYYLRCSGCRTVYQLGTQVRAIKVEDPGDDDTSVRDLTIDH